MSPALLLTVGLDSQLLDTRRMVLQTAGYIVVTAGSIKEAFHLCLNHDFDLVVLCHSIPERDRDGLTCMIRASGSLTPVVAITKLSGQHDVFANATLDADPPKLLIGIRGVLSEEANSSRRSRLARAGNSKRIVEQMTAI
jgi:DNA-binding response OmpR family regulator